MEALNATELYKELRKTTPQRAERVAELVNAEPNEPWIVWCHTNYEADAVCELLPDAVEVRGSDSPGAKEEKLQAFTDGKIGVLVTKPSIAGWGLNWQHCRRQAFIGLNYSYEELHQAVRRSWRFGQTEPVHCHLIAAETEGAVLQSVRRKERAFREMTDAMVEAMRSSGMDVAGAMTHQAGRYEEDLAAGENWKLYLGDCCQHIQHIADNSVDLSVFSPPFANVYMYSNLLEDMGNSKDEHEFYEHMCFLASELYRITRPGRLMAVHCQDLVMYRSHHGVAGLIDMPGDLLRIYQDAGFVYHSKVTIWKCPVTEMQRTKSHGLLYKSLRADASRSRQGRADYMLILRKAPTSETEHLIKPVTHTEESFPLEQWQRWASPVWDDIDQTDVLNVKVAREDKDERHLCPLQLDLIERCIRLWSNEGDVVFSPFAGIGSEGYVALDCGRKFIGIELKPSYWRQAVRNLEDVTKPDPQIDWLATDFGEAAGDVEALEGDEWGDAESASQNIKDTEGAA